MYSGQRSCDRGDVSFPVEDSLSDLALLQPLKKNPHRLRSVRILCFTQESSGQTPALPPELTVVCI